MADAYGAVVLSKSDDCVLDDALILQRLNELNWSNDGRQWDFHDDDKVYTFNYDVQYPTVRPDVTTSITWQDDEGKQHTVSADDATEEQWDRQVDSDEEGITLEEISKRFAPCIKQGSITIAATSNEKCRYVAYEAVTINSDGCVGYEGRVVSTLNGIQSYSEAYTPQ